MSRYQSGAKINRVPRATHVPPCAVGRDHGSGTAWWFAADQSSRRAASDRPAPLKQRSRSLTSSPGRGNSVWTPDASSRWIWPTLGTTNGREPIPGPGSRMARPKGASVKPPAARLPLVPSGCADRLA